MNRKRRTKQLSKLAELEGRAFGRLLLLTAIVGSLVVLQENLASRLHLLAQLHPWSLIWLPIFICYLLRRMRSIKRAARSGDPIATLEREIARPYWPKRTVFGTLAIIWLANTLISWMPLVFPEKSSLATVEGTIATCDVVKGQTYMELNDRPGERFDFSSEFQTEVNRLQPGDRVEALTKHGRVMAIRVSAEPLFTYADYQARLQRADRFTWVGSLVMTGFILIVWFAFSR